LLVDLVIKADGEATRQRDARFARRALRRDRPIASPLANDGNQIALAASLNA
jgi:hypothetical protein